MKKNQIQNAVIAVDIWIMLCLQGVKDFIQSQSAFARW